MDLKLPAYSCVSVTALFTFLLLALITKPVPTVSHETRRPATTPGGSSRATGPRYLSNHNSHDDAPALNTGDSTISGPSPADSMDSNPYDTNYSPSDDDSLPDNTQSNYKPTDLTVIRLNNTSVVLRWDFIMDVSDLQFFKIQYKRTNKGQDWITVPKEISSFLRAFQINDLKPGNYNFAVIAVIEDDNISSDSIKFKIRSQSKISPDEMPNQEAPIIYWTETAPDFFRFKWRYKIKDRDMPNFGYLVYYRSAHQVSEFYIHNTMDENVEIAEMEPDTPYEVKVVAYNDVGISDFSQIKSIKTKSKLNDTDTAGSTSTALPAGDTTSTVSPTSTTEKPGTLDKNPLRPGEERPSNPPQPNETQPPKQNTIAPSILKPTQTNKEPTGPSNKESISNSILSWISSLPEFLIRNQADVNTVIKYLFIVMIPILFITTVICLITCRGGYKKSPPSSTNDSMQFDLEINGYFKNSFPGVEKDYPSLNTHDGHHGFVNNHPHINDFA